MNVNSSRPPLSYVQRIRDSDLTIYDRIEIGDPDLWIPTPDLEYLLDAGLRGVSLAGLPSRTRSKVAKGHVCRVLGYPVPSSFIKSRPRFPGQLFDTYVQQKNNLQVWNEELSPTRRYVLIRPSPEGIVTKVKVVTGDMLAKLDRTGTLTQKYQARFIAGTEDAQLNAAQDTTSLRPFVSADVDLSAGARPTEHPTAGSLMSIAALYDRLKPLVGRRFKDVGYGQERNRGARLHQLVCKALGYLEYEDNGQFPDVRHQLLEVKLQTSPTIDLGLVSPSSVEPLDVPQIFGVQVRHCDVRYAVFYGIIDEEEVALTHVVVTTGEAFFARFPQFQGRVLNHKLQIPLPVNFFGPKSEDLPDAPVQL